MILLLEIILVGGCVQETMPEEEKPISEDKKAISIIPVCGNGECEFGETAKNCCLDCPCPSGFSCQGNKCIELEKCGNGQCGEGETSDNCCIDCGCPNGFYCTDGKCKSKCGDGIKASDETSENCCQDAGCPTGFECKDNRCIELKPVIESSFSPTKETKYFSTSVTFLRAKGEGIGTISLKNSGNDIAKDIQIKITSPSVYFSEKIINVDQLTQDSSKDIRVDLNFLDSVLDIVSSTKIPLNVKIDYVNSANKKYSSENSFEIDVKGRNYMTWINPDMAASWVTPTQTTIREFAAKATAGLGAGMEDSSPLTQKMAARWIFESMRAYGIKYVNDAHASGDYIQFPYETLKNKAGDCDDHAVLYASLLESIGLKSFLMLVPRHIFAGYIDSNNTIVPIETTSSDFDTALVFGMDEYNYYKNSTPLIYPTSSWKNYLPVILPEKEQLKMPYITKQIGDCGVSVSLEKGFYANIPVTFTNSGDAPGAGCAAAVTFDTNGIFGEDLRCWVINPGENKTVNYEPDITIINWLIGQYYCDAI